MKEGYVWRALLSLGYNHLQNKTKNQKLLQLGYLIMTVKEGGEEETGPCWWVRVLDLSVQRLLSNCCPVKLGVPFLTWTSWALPDAA